MLLLEHIVLLIACVAFIARIFYEARTGADPYATVAGLGALVIAAIWFVAYCAMMVMRYHGVDL